MSKIKNEKMAINALKPTEPTATKEEARKLNPVQDQSEKLKELIGVAAEVAQSTIYCRNWKFKNADKHYPHEPLMRRVEKYFPYAVGGPLYVDEPVSKLDLAQCKVKALVMKKEGLRYVFIEKDAKLSDVLMQLSKEVKAS